MGAWDRLAGWLSEGKASPRASASTPEPLMDQAISSEDFERVEARGNVHVEWAPGAPGAVATMAAADEGLLSVTVEGKALIVEMRGGSKMARVSARSTSLAGFACHGLASGWAKGIDAEQFKASLEEGSELRVEGQAIVGRLALSGAGSLDADMLECHAVVAKMTGSGFMNARASGSADVTISGGGEVEVRGDPPASTVRREGPGRAQVGQGRNGGEAPDEESGIFAHISLPKK